MKINKVIQMKKLTPLQKKLEKIETNTCLDCDHAHNFHNISFSTGEPIMAHCVHTKISHLLSQKACKKFRKKTQQD